MGNDNICFADFFDEKIDFWGQKTPKIGSFGDPPKTAQNRGSSIKDIFSSKKSQNRIAKCHLGPKNEPENGSGAIFGNFGSFWGVAENEHFGAKNHDFYPQNGQKLVTFRT